MMHLGHGWSDWDRFWWAISPETCRQSLSLSVTGVGLASGNLNTTRWDKYCSVFYCCVVKAPILPHFDNTTWKLVRKQESHFNTRFWFQSLAYQFAAVHAECCNATGLCFLMDSAFSLHSFLPTPSHHSILLSMPTMLPYTPSPPPPPSLLVILTAV